MGHRGMVFFAVGGPLPPWSFSLGLEESAEAFSLVAAGRHYIISVYFLQGNYVQFSSPCSHASVKARSPGTTTPLGSPAPHLLAADTCTCAQVSGGSKIGLLEPAGLWSSRSRWVVT